MNRFPVRASLAALAVGLVALFAAACGSSDDGPAGAKKMSFKLTDAGCDPHDAKAPGGPDQLRGRKRRLLQRHRARGPRRRNDPRREGEPHRRPLRQLLADPGGRRIHPALQRRRRRRRHADRDRRAAGRGRAPRSKRRSPQYREYLEKNTDELVATTEALRRRGRSRARSRRPNRSTRRPASPTSGSSRWPSPSATSTRASTRVKTTCRRANSVASTGSRKRSGKKTPPRAWRRSPNSCSPTSKNCAQKVKHVELQAVQIANGANELLGEVSASKITGEEERYSHIDLVDFEANVEGAEAAFEAVEPLLSNKDPKLAKEIEAELRRRLRLAEALQARRWFRLLHGTDQGRHAQAGTGNRRARRGVVTGSRPDRRLETA